MSAIRGLGILLKLLYWIVVMGIVGFLLWRYWSSIVAAVKQFIADVRRFFSELFGGGDVDEVGTEVVSESAAPLRPFSAYANPFRGAAASRPTPELIRYSFAALEAWAREHGCARESEQTPHEFAWSVASRESSLAAEVRELADLYAQLAYSGGRVAPGAEQKLRDFWTRIESTSSGTTATPAGAG